MSLQKRRSLDFATPKDELVKRSGYQPDPVAAIKEAKALLDAAGQGHGMRTLDFMVRDLNHHKLFGAAIQEMLRGVNIQTNIRTVVESVWFGDVWRNNGGLKSRWLCIVWSHDNNIAAGRGTADWSEGSVWTP